MSFFKIIQKKGSNPIPPAPDSVRKELVHGVPALRRVSNPDNARSRSTLPSIQPGVRESRKAQANASLHVHARRRKRSSQPRLLSDSDSPDSVTGLELRAKRTKLSYEDKRPQRHDLRSQTAFLEEDDGVFPMVHAAHIASLEKPPKFTLAEPVQSDDFKPLDDIKETLEVVVNHYMHGSDASIFTDDSHGLLRRLKRARDKKDGLLYSSLIQEWNNAVTRMRQHGVFAEVLDKLTWLDLRLIERILTQTYARTVSPRVSTLRQYENGTDNVYGELLPKFISDIFRVTGLGPNHVFVDLGSGVGNVVLQAALEAGCESWGCEIMENACMLADLQEQELKARCRLWGLANGSINLQRGDFLENTTIHRVLPKADVVLVNNQAFTPELNDRLTSQFLDLKEGCQVVSLKSFVPAGHKITSRNLNSAYNVLSVVEKRYYSGCVSWTDTGGSYFISTKDSSRLRKFAGKDAGP
ncbi:MAG: hypothetical protein LQ338_000620 [Usnochroma carphineum]|nr:MAG: hypothetical protein LQ338_000620 [Usnochroma carphineum]